jgi:hypothetical protein
MELRKVATKRRIILLLLVLFALLILWAALAEPFVVYRLSTKAFTGYEIYLLKYPNSQLIETEIKPTSKITMATDYTFYSSDDIDTVLKYMEQQRPGFVHLRGSRVINEPTYNNSTCADDTVFMYFFQAVGKISPCIEIKIYPSDTGATKITISEQWGSLGCPGWLRGI